MSAHRRAAYDNSREALAEIWRIVALRPQLIDAAARAFLFECLRQPQSAQLFGALDDLEGLRYIGPAGYRRTAEILARLQSAGDALRLLDGDAGAWLKPPLRLLHQRLEETLPRMKATAAVTPGFLGRHFANRYEGDSAVDTLHQALQRLRSTRGAPTRALFPVSPQDSLPGPGAAASSESCRSTAQRVDVFVQKVRSLPLVAAPDSEVRGRLQYLLDLGVEVSDRFAATGSILEDAREFGGARRLLAGLETAEVTETSDILTVQVPKRGTSAIRRGPDGRWSLAAGSRSYGSPEGAVAALLFPSPTEPDEQDVNERTLPWPS